MPVIEWRIEKLRIFMESFVDLDLKDV